MKEPKSKPRQPTPIDAGVEAAPAENIIPDWSEISQEFVESGRSTAPALPLDAFPDRLHEMVSAIAIARCVNTDLVAASTIAIISGAVGNRVRLSITKRRTEPCNLFVALVVEPGDGKSEGIDIARESFHAMQADRAGGVTAAAADDGALRVVERERTQKALMKLAREGIAPVVQPGRRPARRWLLSEVTVAGIRKSLAASPDGRVILSDELLTVMTLTGGGREAINARGIMLESFDGKPRVYGNARDGETFIEALQLVILGATQPDRVGLLLGAANDGMAGRFLWCAPDVKRIDELAESDGPLDDLIAALRRLADIEPLGKPGAYSQHVDISADAREALRVANSDWNERKLLAPTPVRGLLARAREQSLRLALVLALGERALTGAELPGGALTGEDAARAVRLMNAYFLPMGERVVSEFKRRDIEPAAMQLARYLARSGKLTVNERADIRRGLGSPLRDAAEIADCFRELEVVGVVRPKERTVGTAGRPRRIWEVNPRLAEVLKAAG